MADYVFLFSGKRELSAFQGSYPERHILGEGKAVVTELKLWTVLMVRPVRLDPFLRCDPDFLSYLSSGLQSECLIIEQKPFHQLDPGQPDLVLPGAAET